MLMSYMYSKELGYSRASSVNRLFSSLGYGRYGSNWAQCQEVLPMFSGCPYLPSLTIIQ